MSDDAHKCHICESLALASKDNTVVRSEHWCVTGVKEAPGHLMITAVVHDDGIAALAPAAAAELGPLIRTLSGGLVAGGAFTRTSFLHLGDAAPHSHFMLIGRIKGDLPVVDGKPLGARITALIDPPRARAELARLQGLFEAV